MIVADAHQYLLDHYKEFDFIWSSPPCPTHSRINTDGHTRPFNYPDMKLYQEIISLGNNWFKGLWIIENVIPYYKPLITPTIKIDRHLYWSNFRIGNYYSKKARSTIEMQDNKERFGFNIANADLKDKRKCLRNLVDPDTGLYILNCARNIITKQNEEQIDLFE